jgi:hypothetical protein
MRKVARARGGVVAKDLVIVVGATALRRWETVFLHVQREWPVVCSDRCWYDVRSLGYGVPFYGRGFGGFRRWGGWPDSYDTWAVPYTEETLIVDVIDAKTNQLIWRGYNQDSLNLGKADKDFTSAVNDVLKKFHSDAKKSAPKN